MYLRTIYSVYQWFTQLSAHVKQEMMCLSHKGQEQMASRHETRA